jgi:hypothetical protein
MVGLMSLLLGEVLYEGAKFIIMLLLLVAGVIIGGKLRERSDVKKAKKAEEIGTKEETAANNS